MAASSERKQNVRKNNFRTERDENAEKESFHEKTNKLDSWKEKWDTILESSNNVEGDFNRDIEVTRDALRIIDDVAVLEEPLFMRCQHLEVPDSPKERANVVEYVETTGAELGTIDSRLEVPAIRENRFDDESIDRSDDDSGELHVCRDNLKTYPPRWADVLYIGTRVPRIPKRPDDFFRMFEKSLFISSPRQTQSSPKINFHPSDNSRANQLWDEFVSNNPEIFARNASSNSLKTNEAQNIRKRKFFKTDRKTRLGLVKSETQKASVPEKKLKKSGSKRARNADSSSSAQKMVTIDGSDFCVEDRNVYEISSDSDDEFCPQKSAGQTRRSRTARNRYDRLTEIEDSIEDFTSRSRSSCKSRRQERTNQSTENRPKKPIEEDQYRSKLPDRRSSVTRSRFDDCMENRSSNVREETPTAEDRRCKRKINEASGSKSVSENDRPSRRLGFAERMRRLKSSSATSSAIIRSPDFRDDPFGDLGARKNRVMSESTIGKNRSRVFDPLAEKNRLRKTKTNKSAVSKISGENREIESLYDERSAIGNLDSAEPKKIFKSAETIIEENTMKNFTEDPRNRGDSSITNRTISSSRRSLPTIRSDVALTAGRINRIGNGRWEIFQPTTSIQISR